MSSFRRWSHSAISFENKVLVFGGFGVDVVDSTRNSPDQRLSSVAVLDHDAKWEIQSCPSEKNPNGRERHTAVRVGSENKMIVFGGRTNPLNALDDAWILDLMADSNKWSLIDTEVRPPRRYRHAATWTPFGMLVFGGCSLETLSNQQQKQHVYGDLWLLSPVNSNSDSSSSDSQPQIQWSWRQIQPMGDEFPSARHSHTLTCVGDHTVYLFGGFGLGGIHCNPEDERLYALDLRSMTWSIPFDPANRISSNSDLKPQLDLSLKLAPASRYSAAAVAFDDRYLILVGGCSVDDPIFNALFVFDTQTNRWSRPDVQLPPMMLCKHSITLSGNRLFIIGGGALCFSFGACFNSVTAFDISMDISPSASASSACPLLFSPVAEWAIPEEVLSSASSDDSKTASLAATSSSSSSSSSSSTDSAQLKAFCQVCSAGFPSRNKLNQHLINSGHRTCTKTT